jgi:hypothetical protein
VGPGTCQELTKWQLLDVTSTVGGDQADRITPSVSE